MFQGITPYKGIETRVKVFQSVGDIMTGILSTHDSYRRDYDRIAAKFDYGDTMTVCRDIYNYLLAHTHYVIEPNDKQTLRSPAAILAMGANPKKGLDCKSYSLFIGGVLDALNRRGRKIKWCYRFASYRLADRLPHHVFVVVNPNTNNEIFVDPVIKPFNYKKPYFYKIDKSPRMALYSISGIGRKSNRAERKEKKQAAKKRIVSKIKKTGRVFVKYNPATGAARNAFLLLTKLNLNRLAERLVLLEKKKPGKLRKFWESIGGNFEALKRAINHGGKKRGAQIGLEPVTTATAAAVTATPILIKIIKLLEEAGIKKEDLQKVAKQVIAKAIDKKAEREAAADEEPIYTEPGDVISEAEDMPADVPPMVETETETETETEDGVGNIIDNVKKNPILWIAGAAGAYILLTKKRGK